MQRKKCLLFIIACLLFDIYVYKEEDAKRIKLAMLVKSLFICVILIIKKYIKYVTINAQIVQLKKHEIIHHVQRISFYIKILFKYLTSGANNEENMKITLIEGIQSIIKYINDL